MNPRLYRVRRQAQLSAASLALAALATIALTAWRRPEADYLALVGGLAVILSPLGVLVGWGVARRTVRGAVDAPAGWVPVPARVSAWVILWPLPLLLVVAASYIAPRNEGTLVAPVVLMAAVGIAEAVTVVVDERRSGAVLVCDRTWRASNPLWIPAADLARLESGGAASGAAR
jgi:asparagine N-glycosylation enzyme membrane subunit Stt3